MEDNQMSEATGQADSVPTVNYELALSAEEARQGATKLLSRNGKRLKVNIPAGVDTGSVVKLSNALQITDGHPGDILILVKIKTEEKAVPEPEIAGVKEIGESDFEKEVLKASLPVVVDFWAAWCGPCRMMAPVMESASAQYQGRFKFCKINVDENPGVASQYQAMSIPLLVFFKNGQEVDRSVGAISAAELQAKLDSLL
jgi:thioredoxin 1